MTNTWEDLVGKVAAKAGVSKMDTECVLNALQLLDYEIMRPGAVDALMQCADLKGIYDGRILKPVAEGL